MVATLGLLQLGHETTPELAQLLATALLVWVVAAALVAAARIHSCPRRWVPEEPQAKRLPPPLPL